MSKRDKMLLDGLDAIIGSDTRKHMNVSVDDIDSIIGAVIDYPEALPHVESEPSFNIRLRTFDSSESLNNSQAINNWVSTIEREWKSKFGFDDYIQIDPQKGGAYGVMLKFAFVSGVKELFARTSLEKFVFSDGESNVVIFGGSVYSVGEDFIPYSNKYTADIARHFGLPYGDTEFDINSLANDMHTPAGQAGRNDDVPAPDMSFDPDSNIAQLFAMSGDTVTNANTGESNKTVSNNNDTETNPTKEETQMNETTPTTVTKEPSNIDQLMAAANGGTLANSASNNISNVDATSREQAISAMLQEQSAARTHNTASCKITQFVTATTDKRYLSVEASKIMNSGNVPTDVIRVPGTLKLPAGKDATSYFKEMGQKLGCSWDPTGGEVKDVNGTATPTGAWVYDTTKCPNEARVSTKEVMEYLKSCAEASQAGQPMPTAYCVISVKAPQPNLRGVIVDESKFQSVVTDESIQMSAEQFYRWTPFGEHVVTSFDMHALIQNGPAGSVVEIGEMTDKNGKVRGRGFRLVLKKRKEVLADGSPLRKEAYGISGEVNDSFDVTFNAELKTKRLTGTTDVNGEKRESTYSIPLEVPQFKRTITPGCEEMLKNNGLAETPSIYLEGTDAQKAERARKVFGATLRAADDKFVQNSALGKLRNNLALAATNIMNAQRQNTVSAMADNGGDIPEGL